MDEPTLLTERLAGRAVRAGDAALMARIWGVPATAYWLNRDTLPKSAERIAADTARAAAHWETHGFGHTLLFDGATAQTRLAEGRFVGWVLLLLSVIDGEGMVELGWAITAEAQGAGYATEAARAVLAEAQARGLRRVVAYTRPSNQASLRVMAKLGLEPVRRFEQAGHPQILHAKTLS